MNTNKTYGLFIVCMIVGFASSMLFAEEISLEQKLSKDIKISLNDVLITEALEKISKEIDVPIRLSDEAEFKLPYGRATRLSVTLKGPAAESLTQMLNEFFMRYAIGINEIIICPRPELDHIIDRPSPRQLQLLKAIYTKPIRIYITDNVAATVNTALEQEVFISPIELYEDINMDLRKLAGEKMVTFTPEPPGEVHFFDLLPPYEKGNELKEYTLSTPVLFPQLLRRDIMTEQPTWYIPSIDLPNQIPEIRIIEEYELWDLKRKQLLDINFENKTLQEVFQRLADRADINYDMNPKAAQALEEHVTVSMQNVTAMQAMKKIADMARLRYEERYGGGGFYLIEKIKPVQPDLLLLEDLEDTDGAASSEPADRGPYVGKISIPMDGGKYYIEYMLRESDLTDELKKLRSEKIREILGTQTKEDSPEQAVGETR